MWLDNISYPHSHFRMTLSAPPSTTCSDLCFPSMDPFKQVTSRFCEAQWTTNASALHRTESFGFMSVKKKMWLPQTGSRYWKSMNQINNIIIVFFGDFPGGLRLRIHLSCMGCRFRPWSKKQDPTWCGSTKPKHNNYWVPNKQLRPNAVK